MKLPFSVDLSGKVAVVTGAGGVLCSEIACALAACGAKVALLGRRAETLVPVADRIAKDGGTALVTVADVLDKDALLLARDQILQKFGPCDLLINGAGGNHPAAITQKEVYEPGDETLADVKSFFSLDPNGFGSVFDLNLLGTILPSQVFALDMVGRPGCSILQISSMSAFRALTKVPAYSAAKAAVSNFTQWMAVHFAGAGIRVNAIAPGFFATRQNRDLLFSADGSLTARSEKILRGTPLGRFGTPDELLGAVLFLLSHEASGFITGVVLPIDGGFSAYSGV